MRVRFGRLLDDRRVILEVEGREVTVMVEGKRIKGKSREVIDIEYDIDVHSGLKGIDPRCRPVDVSSHKKSKTRQMMRRIGKP